MVIFPCEKYEKRKEMLAKLITDEQVDKGRPFTLIQEPSYPLKSSIAWHLHITKL